jgi:hypothetical protein
MTCRCSLADAWVEMLFLSLVVAHFRPRRLAPPPTACVPFCGCFFRPCV